MSKPIPLFQVATCSYVRYARLGGGQESKNAICILNMNMINDKVSIMIVCVHDLKYAIGLHHNVVLALHPAHFRDSQDLHAPVPGVILHDQILPDEGQSCSYFLFSILSMNFLGSNASLPVE